MLQAPTINHLEYLKGTWLVHGRWLGLTLQNFLLPTWTVADASKEGHEIAIFMCAVRTGLEMLMVGSAAAGLAYLIGAAAGSLLGLPASKRMEFADRKAAALWCVQILRSALAGEVQPRCRPSGAQAAAGPSVDHGCSASSRENAPK